MYRKNEADLGILKSHIKERGEQIVISVYVRSYYVSGIFEELYLSLLWMRRLLIFCPQV